MSAGICSIPPEAAGVCGSVTCPGIFQIQTRMAPGGIVWWRTWQCYVNGRLQEFRCPEDPIHRSIQSRRFCGSGTGSRSDEGVGGKVPEEVPAKLFSERSGTITHVPLCGHNLLLKTSHVLFK